MATYHDDRDGPSSFFEPLPERRHASSNYVSSLPLDAARRILCHLSDTGDIPVDSCRHAFFSPSSPFAPVLRDYFRVLQVKEIYEPTTGFRDNTMIVDLAAVKRCDDKEYVFDHCLGAVRCLILPSATGRASMAVDDLLHRIGNQIVRLEFSERLALSQRSLGQAHSAWMRLCPKLTELVYSCHSLEFMLPLWLKIGATLTALDLTCDNTRYWSPTLDSIRAHCNALTSISLRYSHGSPGVPVVPHDDFSEFIASYGEKLQYAELPSLDKAACVKIASACPNVRVKLTSRSYEGISALGDRVESLAVELFSSNWMELKEALTACCGILALRVFHHTPLPVGACASLFGAKLMNLRDLSLPLIPCRTMHPRSCLLDLMSKQTGNLRRLVYACITVEDGSMFARLVALNPRLEDVGIFESKHDPIRNTIEDVLSRLTGFLSVFMRCRALRVLRARFLSALPQMACVSDALVPYRHRGITFKLRFSNTETGLTRSYTREFPEWSQ